MPKITYLDLDSSSNLALHCTALYGLAFFLRTITKLFGSLSLNLQLDTGKSKAILIQAWKGPEGSRSLRLPDFKTITFNPQEIFLVVISVRG